MRAINQPISLNWVGIAILKLEDSGHDKLNDKILLDDDKIEKFINDSMEKFSFFLGAKIPNIVDQIKENKND
ncbi:hypothetical protein [uncultured Methanobrevibacter sp.]|uniref:hypothetical protein n=1 Tax=uncultured Methanobrevibacter sp. TaxID=253161 RepID=UPI0026044C8C|nr:hypothetical protein [uncultured Methanobrevibacter sp.]